MSFPEAVAFSLLAAGLAWLQKEQGGRLAPLLSLAAGVLLLAACLPRLATLTDTLRKLGESSGLTPYLGQVLKVLGVGYVAELGADICRDLGETGSAQRLLLFAKLEILLLCLPLLLELTDLAGQLIAA